MTGIEELERCEVTELDSTVSKVYQIQKNAMSYADRVMKNDDMAAIYKKKGSMSDMQLQRLAFHDFITPPQIIGIYCEKFLALRNRPIIIRTRDEVGVRRVSVKIYNSKNELLEKGMAKQYLQNERWFYFVRKDTLSWKEVRIEAKAVDYPGNFSESYQWIAL